MKPNKYYEKLEEEGYYETIDKRSKDYREYKEWKATKESYKALKENVESQPKGLGDTIAKITKATGIDKVVKFIAGDDCGCDDRKELWNKEFKYKTVKCLEEDDYVFLKDFLNRRGSLVDYHDKVRLIDIYNHVFSARENRKTHCSSCVARVVKNLERYMSAYQ
tara:strand:- start:64 stop:555 length:492 start_codon:yes stop_codon:yes gene_type:complete